jgi:Fur family peroxide stress response transcriptional regulator
MNNLIQQLRDRGIAVTPQRVAVIAILQNRRDHPSAENIYQEVRRQLPAISFNTVYKTLEVFCQKGLVVKVNPLHEVARYDGETGPHAHLICRQCHHIVDLEWQPEDYSPLPPYDQTGFQVEYPTLTLWGLCSKCQQKESPKED